MKNILSFYVIGITVLLMGDYHYNINKYFLSSELQSTIKYKVYKIDSVKNVYLIYAKKKDSIFKILSHKEFTKGGEKIRINKSYGFKLKSLFSKKYDLVNGIIYYDTPVSIESDSITNLFTAENVVGLYFIKK